MLRAILISLLAGATIGVTAFVFGHAWASKIYAELLLGIQKAKSEAQDEVVWLRAEIAKLKEKL